MSIILPRDNARCGCYKQLAVTRTNKLPHDTQHADAVIISADSLPSNVELYEEHPVLSMQKKSATYSIHAQDASISSPKVILATSIFAKEFGYLRSRMIPTMTYASISRPLSSDELSVFPHEQS